MNTIGFSSSEQEEIFHIVGAILHVGNVTFKQEGSYAKVATHDVLKDAAQVNNLILIFF